MRKTIRLAALIAALTCTTLTATAASPSEFYASLLRRGVAAFDAARYDEATQHLRLAAFGFIDNVEQYQTAHAYLAATYEKSGLPERARDSVRRIAQAQRISPRFASLTLPAPVRATVEKLAAGVLTPAELSGLRGTTPMPAAAQTPSPVRTVVTGGTNTTQPPPATTTTTATTTTKPPATVERVDVEVVKPAPVKTQPPTTQPQPQASTTQTQPPATQPRQPAPQPRPATTPATTTPARPALTAAERAMRFAAGERALAASNLAEARRIYSELLATPGTDHATFIRIGEGFYRARDFTSTLAAFDRAGTLRSGEEPYRYYMAVASYETGQYARAKRELAAALPYIEITPDVALYRAKIQAAVQ
jgi:tetratricopeptide (TPR) repeat protein